MMRVLMVMGVCVATGGWGVTGAEVTRERVVELPEVVVEGKGKKFLHLLAYVRERSTLLSCGDSVMMFREKMVDFMLPADGRWRGKGWRNPRVLRAESYYRFTNANGLDSVSDKCGNNFSWSDWVWIMPAAGMPRGLVDVEAGRDTLMGRYSPVEVWVRDGDRMRVDVDVLADTAGRKWVPNMMSVFRGGDVDFDRFRLSFECDNVAGDCISAQDLRGYSYEIESTGRGSGMFMVNRRDEPASVTTCGEVYVVDREFLSSREARRWEQWKFDPDEIAFVRPDWAEELEPELLALVERVGNIDRDGVRLAIAPDQRLVGLDVTNLKRRDNFGKRVWQLLKTVTGVSRVRSNRNVNRKWREFSDEQKRRNRERDLPE